MNDEDLRSVGGKRASRVQCCGHTEWNEIENGDEEDVNDELEISRVQVISIIQFHCFFFFFYASMVLYRWQGKAQVLPIASAVAVR